MIKQLLNSVIAKYCDLSVSRRSIICLSLRLQQIIDLLTTGKSRYFNQPLPIIFKKSDTWYPFHIAPNSLDEASNYIQPGICSKLLTCTILGLLRQSWILDSTPWIPDSSYGWGDSLSVELGFRISIVSGIPDSLSCIPDSKAQNFDFLKFLGILCGARWHSLFSNHAMSKSSNNLWQHACSCGWQLTNLLQIYYDNSDSHSHKVAYTDRQHKAESYDKLGIL